MRKLLIRTTNDRGVTCTEYALLSSIITCCVLFVVVLLGQQIRGVFYSWPGSSQTMALNPGQGFDPGDSAGGQYQADGGGTTGTVDGQNGHSGPGGLGGPGTP